MSRTLSKILVICALVVVVPLMVVGTTLAAYFSINSTVKIASYVVDDNYAVKADGEKDENGEEFFAGYSYAGKRNISGEINAGHAKTVKVSAEYDEKAYRFEGWFRGTAAEYATAAAQGPVELKTENTLDVKMADEGSYLAVYSVYDFDITYTYFENPEEQSGSPKTEQVTDVVYGSALKDLSSTYQGTMYRFNPNGWKYAGTDNRFLRATFDQKGGAVSLSEPWQEASKVNLNYFDRNGQRVHTEEIAQNQDHTLLTVEQINNIITNDIVVDAGYTYFWKDSQGSKIVDNKVNTSEASVNVYLDREAIEYTATLEIPSWATYSKSKDITFTVESDKSVFAEWTNPANFTSKYSFWHLNSIFTYNGIDYKYNKASGDGADVKTLEDFIQVVVEESPKTTKSVSLKMQEDKAFTKLIVSGTVSAVGTIDDDGFYDLDIYKDNDEFHMDLSGTEYPTDTTTLAQLLNVGTSTYKGLESNRTQHDVELKRVTLHLKAGAELTIDVADLLNKNLVDFIDEILKQETVVENEIFEITDLRLCFVAKN